jgi:hypothetical protein
MRLLYCILLPSLVVGCATKKETPSARRVDAHCTAIAANDMSNVRTPETVKAYPVGRYTDPNFPDQMHERHTMYRREQAARWNYRPSKPYALPLGPVVATSNPSPSYFAKTNAEQINAQQKAYAESLLEQNIALKKRIDALQQKDSTIRDLQTEIERLRKELDSRPPPKSTPPAPDAPPQKRTTFRRRTPSISRTLVKLSSFPDPKLITRRSSSRKCDSTTNSWPSLTPRYDGGSKPFSLAALLHAVPSHSSPKRPNESDQTQPSGGG